LATGIFEMSLKQEFACRNRTRLPVWPFYSGFTFSCDFQAQLVKTNPAARFEILPQLKIPTFPPTDFLLEVTKDMRGFSVISILAVQFQKLE
jgi:hypothetical protein